MTFVFQSTEIHEIGVLSFILELFLAKLWPKQQMYGILTYMYLHRNLVNYEPFMLFETENFHFKNFLYTWSSTFCYFKWTKMSKNVSNQKNKKPPARNYCYLVCFFLFFFQQSVWKSKDSGYFFSTKIILEPYQYFWLSPLMSCGHVKSR